MIDTTFAPTKNYARRRLFSKVFLSLSAGSALGTILILFLILGYTLFRGLGAVDIDFFTQLPKPVGEPGGGMANAIVGSLIILALASALAFPIGIFTGIFLAEYRSSRFADFVRFTIETMAGVPSIVVGIFAFALIVRPAGTFSAWSAGFALGVIMIPIFARAAEVALRTVPFSLREASLALGVPVWRTVLRVVIPTAAPGLITAFMLALARAGGETAPLLFTAFGNRWWHEGLNNPIAALPLQIYFYASGPYDDWHRQAWAGALVLVLITVLVIGIIRAVFGRSNLAQ